MRSLLAFAFCVSAVAAPYASNRHIQVRLDEHTGALTVTDLRSHHEWVQKPVGSWSVAGSRVDASEIRLTLHDAANNLDLTAQVALSKDKPEMEVTLSGSGPLKSNVGFPFPFVTGKGTGLVVPMNEGILYPVDDAGINNRRLVAYGGHGICIPWFGATDLQSGESYMAILETPDDAQIDITRQRLRFVHPSAMGCFAGTVFLRSQDSLRVLRSRRLCGAGQALP